MLMLDEAVVTAGDLMTRDVAVVHPETSLLEAVKIMARRRISGMPVTDSAGRSVTYAYDEGNAYLLTATTDDSKATSYTYLTDGPPAQGRRGRDPADRREHERHRDSVSRD
jgi:CBS domain-containing protein